MEQNLTGYAMISGMLSWEVMNFDPGELNTKGSQTDLQPQLRHPNPMLVE